jgi:hypothetical protein
MEILMVFFTLLVIGGLCLIFKSTRLVGVVGLTILMLLVPGLFLMLLVIGGLFIYCNYKLNQRRNFNVYKPELLD